MTSATIGDRPDPPAHPWTRPAEPGPARVAKHELVSTIRRIADHVALLDVRELTEQQLAGVRADCEAVEAVVAAWPSLRTVGGPHLGDPADRPLVERGPISGLSNAVAPPLVMDVADAGHTIRAHATFGPLYEGPPGMVHGGVLLAVFDEVLAYGQLPSGQIGMTGTVTVKLLGGVPLGRRVDFAAGTVGVDGRKVTVWATASVEDRTVAEATAICIRVPKVPDPT